MSDDSRQASPAGATTAAAAQAAPSIGDRVISGAQARPWNLPAVGQEGSASGPLTAGRLEAIEEEARKAGRAAGHADGLQAAQGEIRRRGAQVDALLAGLAAPLERLDAQVEEEILELVMAIARRLVRREIKSDPGEIMAVIREGIAALPVGERAIKLQLHPEDARLVEELLGAQDGGPSCRIIRDPAITRGGARISTDISAIDATLETRINRVFDRMLGSDRQGDGADA